MKFRSILSFSFHLRTNVIFCLIFAILSSLQTLISSVKIQPQEKIRSIWSSQQGFTTCFDETQTGGSLKWFRRDQEVDTNPRAKVYQQDSGASAKLFFINASKKDSDVYECRNVLDNKVLTSDKFELKVYNTINMDGNKDSHVGIEGGPFSMACLTKFDSDSAESTVTWMHNNRPLKDRETGFSILSRTEQSVVEKRVRSTLTIKNLSKENEGVYVCQSFYANKDFSLTDMKSIDINLRVQFKPRFPENTQKYVWISQSEGPVSVNVTCLVNADPIAEFQWLNGHAVPLENVGDKLAKHKIVNTENLSVLTLEYQNTDVIKNAFNDPDGRNRKFQCKARNSIGEAKVTFELNVGKLPDTPFLANYSYENGHLILTISDSDVEPPIDIYELKISDKHSIYFNSSNRNELSNNTYEIQVEVPSGVHDIKIFAHNPVGWSVQDGAKALHLVINSAYVGQQYVSFVLIALTLSLVNAF